MLIKIGIYTYINDAKQGLSLTMSGYIVVKSMEDELTDPVTSTGGIRGW